jgi:hypothetical protein
MASVDGVYVGPLTPADVPALLEDVRAGRPVLPDKQLARRLVADPHANSREFPAHPAEHTARVAAAAPEMPPESARVGPSIGGDRPGPTAPHETEAQ